MSGLTAIVAGEARLFGFFVGQVMHRSGGKADPKRVGELLLVKLE